MSPARDQEALTFIGRSSDASLTRERTEACGTTSVVLPHTFASLLIAAWAAGVALISECCGYLRND